MINRTTTRWTLMTGLLAALSLGPAAAGEAPTVAEKMAGLQGMCAESADARAQRQAAEPLYDRLGSYEKIHALTTEIVKRHNENPEIKHMFTNVDSKALATHVADFLAAGTGGTATYSGRDMPAAHAHLDLTDADFLSAGGDIIGAMKALGYGQNEIDEVVCILVSLKDQVVFE